MTSDQFFSSRPFLTKKVNFWFLFFLDCLFFFDSHFWRVFFEGFHIMETLQGVSQNSQMMIQALYNAAANALLLLLGVALYYNYIMLEVYVTPMLWALLCSVVLRKPKDTLYSWLKSFLSEGVAFGTPRRARLPRDQILRSFPFKQIALPIRAIGRLFSKFLERLEEIVGGWLTKFNENFVFEVERHRKKKRRKHQKNKSGEMSSGEMSSLLPREGPVAALAAHEGRRNLMRRRHRIRSCSLDSQPNCPLPEVVDAENEFVKENVSSSVGPSVKQPTTQEKQPLIIPSPSNVHRTFSSSAVNLSRSLYNTSIAAPSALYFRALTLFYLCYFCYSLILPMWYGIVVLVIIALAAASLLAALWVLVFVFCLSMRLDPPLDLFALLCLISIDPLIFLMSLLDSSLGGPFHRLWNGFLAPFGRNMVLWVKDILFANLHGVVAAILVTAGITAMSLFGTFFAIQCAGEAQEALVGAQSFFDRFFSRTVWLGVPEEQIGAMTEEGIKVMEKVLGVSWADLHVPGMVSMSTGTPFIKEMHPAISLFQHFSHVYGSYLGPEVVLPTSLNNTLHHKEQLELLYNMSISLEFTDPLYWRTVRDLFRESVEIFSILFPSGYEEFKVMTLVGKIVQILAGSGQLVWNGSTTVLSALLGTVVMGCLAVFSFGFSCVLFVTCLFYLLKSEEDVLSMLTFAFPFDQRTRGKVMSALTNAISGVFLSALKVGLFHSSLTWLSFRVTGSPFAYLAAVVSGVLAVMPLAPSFLVGALAAIHLWNISRPFLGLGIFCIHYYAYFFIDTVIYSEIPNAHPYLVGLALISGIYAFQMQGIVLGPTLLTIPVILYSLYVEFISVSRANLGGASNERSAS